MEKKTYLKNKDFVLGIIMIAFAVFMFVLTKGLPNTESQFFDSRFMPYLVSIMSLLLGIVQIIKHLGKESEHESIKKDFKTLAITTVLLACYIFLYGQIGFIVASIVFLFLQIIILTPNYYKKNYVLYGVLAVVTTLAIYYLFLILFKIKLPSGILSSFM